METDKDLVSILIPTYNRESYIYETIYSAISQTYDNIEIIVVDNCSEDNSWDIIKNIANEHKNIRCYQNFENVGPVSNWKRCIELAKGKYAKILFSDDLIEPDFIEKSMACFYDNKQLGFVVTGIRTGECIEQSETLNSMPLSTGVYSVAEFLNLSLFEGRAPLSPGCAMFPLEYLKCNLVEEIPSPSLSGFSSHGAGPDLLLYLQACLKYDTFMYIDEPLAFFRSHKGSLSVINRPDDDLFNYYTQAKLWFVQKNYSKELSSYYFAYTWVSYIVNMKKLYFPRKFSGKFSFSQVNIYRGIYYAVKDIFMRKLSKKDESRTFKL
jgi:glycosyltransferase involved in cell wall biosynthesis